jgi:hypothetical protein
MTPRQVSSVEHRPFANGPFPLPLADERPEAAVPVSDPSLTGGLGWVRCPADRASGVPGGRPAPDEVPPKARAWSDGTRGLVAS